MSYYRNWEYNPPLLLYQKKILPNDFVVTNNNLNHLEILNQWCCRSKKKVEGDYSANKFGKFI